MKKFIVISLLIIGIAILLFRKEVVPTQAQTTSLDWPQLQRDGTRSGYSPNSKVSSPFAITWRFHPTSNKVSVSGQTQPVVAGGTMCVGFYDGKLYCLDAATGVKKWEFQTGGPIINTAAIDGNTIYVGSSDGALYGVNLATGQQQWKYQTGKPIHAAPCVSGTSLYITSADGFVYALSTSGNLKWKFDTGYPILSSAACVNNTVYIGNEGMYAFAITDNQTAGVEKWRKRLQGQSFSGYWPVVSVSNNIVFFRTEPHGGFHNVLGDGDSTLSQGGADKTQANIDAEQTRIINHLNTEVLKWKTFWALDTNTGNEKYTAPVLYTSGEFTTPVPPVVDDGGNRAWVVWRTKYTTFGGTGVRPMVDLGKLNLQTGKISHFSGPKSAYVHLIGDETTVLTAEQNSLIATGRGTVTGISLTSESSFAIANSQNSNDDYANGGQGPFAYANGYTPGSILGGGGQGGGYAVGPASANNRLYWIARYGLIVAVE